MDRTCHSPVFPQILNAQDGGENIPVPGFYQRGKGKTPGISSRPASALAESKCYKEGHLSVAVASKGDGLYQQHSLAMVPILPYCRMKKQQKPHSSQLFPGDTELGYPAKAPASQRLPVELCLSLLSQSNNRTQPIPDA